MALESFESGVERMVKGVFSRGSRSGIKPVELGRRLLREIDDHRHIDAKGDRVVPNSFTFSVSQRDHALLTQHGDLLLRELAETAREYARSEGYKFTGAVTVQITADPDAKPGRIGVRSQVQDTGGFSSHASLRFASGERLPLGTEAVSVGRMPDCTIPLDDTNVSRRHCEIRRGASGYVVVDLGSTNGTKVNGVKIEGEHVLLHGDIVGVGNVHLTFEAQ